MNKEQLLNQISRQIKKCRLCRLYRTRANAVPGVGPANAKIMFIGEAPGFNEDQQGIPFCGRAGDLLDQLLESIKIARKGVWIGNVIKCRPPDNRDPMVDEIRNCQPYLEEQIRAINPKLIVTLGRFAMAHFIKNGKISDDHGKAKRIADRLVYPIYHPAAALRSEGVLRDLKKDFSRIPSLLEKNPDDFEFADAKERDKGQMTLL